MHLKERFIGPLDNSAQLNQKVLHPILINMQSQLRCILQERFGEQRQLVCGAALHETLHNPASIPVLGGNYHTMAAIWARFHKLIDDELACCGTHRRDALLDHMVRMGVMRGIPDVTFQLRGDSFALFVASVVVLVFSIYGKKSLGFLSFMQGCKDRGYLEAHEEWKPGTSAR